MAFAALIHPHQGTWPGRLSLASAGQAAVEEQRDLLVCPCSDCIGNLSKVTIRSRRGSDGKELITFGGLVLNIAYQIGSGDFFTVG